jgi:hypothetical protein
VPAGLDEHDLRARAEPRDGDAAPEVHRPLAVRLGLRLLEVLQRVVDDQHVDGLAGQRAADADAVHAAGVAFDLPAAGRAGVLAEPDPEVEFTVGAVERLRVGLDRGAVPAGHLVGVGHDRDAQLGVLHEQPQRERVRDPLGLALLRGHEHREAVEVVGVDQRDELAVDELERRRLDDDGLIAMCSSPGVAQRGRGRAVREAARVPSSSWSTNGSEVSTDTAITARFCSSSGPRR